MVVTIAPDQQACFIQLQPTISQDGNEHLQHANILLRYFCCVATLHSLIDCSLFFCNFIHPSTYNFLADFYPPTKSEGYSFGVDPACICPSVHSFHPFRSFSSVQFIRQSVHTCCLSGTISQYLLVRFNSFLVQMISTLDSQYPISLVKIDPLTLELLPLFWHRQL